MNQSLPSQYSTANYNGGASAAGGASLKVKLNQLEVSIPARLHWEWILTNSFCDIGNREHHNRGDPIQQEGGVNTPLREGVPGSRPGCQGPRGPQEPQQRSKQVRLTCYLISANVGWRTTWSAVSLSSAARTPNCPSRSAWLSRKRRCSSRTFFLCKRESLSSSFRLEGNECLSALLDMTLKYIL